jgi:hypothetical protein
MRGIRPAPISAQLVPELLQHTKQRKRFQNHSGNAIRCAFEQVRADPCSTGSPGLQTVCRKQIGTGEATRAETGGNTQINMEKQLTEMR